MDSMYREKTAGIHGDSKLLEEKLDQVSDLKTQIRCLITDNEEVKLNQEELNANMTTLTHQMSLLAEAFEKANGNGRTDVFRRVSRLSRRSFRTKLPSNSSFYIQKVSQSQPVSPNDAVSVSLKKPALARKASLEGIVKQLTNLAVSISTDDVKKTAPPPSSLSSSQPEDHKERKEESLHAKPNELSVATSESRRASGASLPEKLVTIDNKKLKRTNLMKRRESQALLEGVRKLRGAHQKSERSVTYENEKREKR